MNTGTRLAAALAALLLLAWPASAQTPRIPRPDMQVLLTDDDPDAGTNLLGRPAPAWSFDRWARGGPHTLAALRGRPVLIRWWTEGCHFCETTLPAFEALRRRHERDGLVTVGVFHPKPPGPRSNRHIVDKANRLGYRGAIAVDERWTTLERWWLEGHPERNWTSVSFLLDRHGVVRWVHGGGEWHPSDDPRHATCAAQHAELERVLAQVLAEDVPRP
jgi:thiol-disulfide isomerase/thioredoxin